MRSKPAVLLLVLVAACSVVVAALPPLPVPPENGITEPKRLLGKVLFWDEQLSSDSTVACGTCHTPERAGTDERIGVNPGPDGAFGGADDIFGSPGVVKQGTDGAPQVDPIFGLSPQVTRRSANGVVDSAFLPEAFWDGRARGPFLDPETGAVAIASGGALENQAIGPILSGVEMASQGRTWAQVAHKLTISEPLGYATSLPADLAAALSSRPSYPQLFQAAFGDPTITVRKIAFAIATYERTLNADETPWDRFVGGDTNALTPGQQAGWNFFRTSPCAVCHAPPLFTNNTFRVIGVRPPSDDTGRQEVTGLNGDRGRFKVPTLRNVGLKTTFMHNGRLNGLQAVIAFYRPNNPDRFPDNLDPILPVGVPLNVQPALIDFMANGLRDPRVAAQTFPFDRPALFDGLLQQLSFDPDRVTLRWPALPGSPTTAIYRGLLSDLRTDTDHDGEPDGGYGACVSATDPNRTDAVFVDPDRPAPGAGYFYVKGILDGGTLRGLGATSAGLPREVMAPCP